MKKYSTLQAIGLLFKIAGWCVAGLGVLIFLLSCLGWLVGASTLQQYQDVISPVYGVLASLFILVSAFLYGAFLIALGELIDLLIDMSISSQRTATLIERSLNQAQSPARLVPPR